MLEDLGNIGDFLGGIGVVVTLAYLAIQIRQNTRTVRASYTQAADDSLVAYQLKIASDAELNDIYWRGMQIGLSTLNETEVQRFRFVMSASTRIIETQHGHFERDLVDKEHWNRYRDALLYYARQRGFIDWWNIKNLTFTPSFTDAVEEAIRSESAAS